MKGGSPSGVEYDFLSVLKLKLSCIFVAIIKDPSRDIIISIISSHTFHFVSFQSLSNHDHMLNNFESTNGTFKARKQTVMGPYD